MKRKKIPFWPFGLLAFAYIFLADIYTKRAIIQLLAPGESFKALPGVWFTYVQNTGALWSSFQGMNVLFIWLSVVAIGLLLYFNEEFSTTIEKICFAMLLAGILGNFLDRVAFGFVIDFIDLHWWPVFNIADAAISTSIVVYLLEQVRQRR